MATYNFFLTTPADTKGGGVFFEGPSSLENIVLQTAATEPDAFESRLADELMAIFAAGIWALDQIVDDLNRRGCFDREGSAWNTASFQTQLQQSVRRLFAAASP